MANSYQILQNNPTLDDLTKAGEVLATAAIKELLQEKHLFQTVSVVLTDVKEAIKEARYFDPKGSTIGEAEKRKKDLVPRLTKHLDDTFHTFSWDVTDDLLQTRQQSKMEFPGTSPAKRFQLTPPATLIIPCSHCDHDHSPHNPCPEVGSSLLVRTVGSRQIFQFPYLCQSCKWQPLVFFVLREGEKLKLIGRSEFPKVQIDPSVPKQEREFFKRALISDKSGFHLAAFLYLRSFVEKYFRRMTECGTERLTGDQMGDRYKDWLDIQYPRYPAGFPSLKKVYEDLSGHIHAGHDSQANSPEFDRAVKQILVHFQQLKVLKDNEMLK